MSLQSHLSVLPLKEMDPYLLGREILERAEALSDWVDREDLQHAIDLAAYLHRKQTRKVRGNMVTTHYIEHPLRNALRLLRYGVTDNNVIIATLLHDTVEDCILEYYHVARSFEAPATFSGREFCVAYLVNVFGIEVAYLVDSVTNPSESPVGLTRAQKRERYAAHVTEVIQDPKVALVKFSDFIDNAASLEHQLAGGEHEMVAHLTQKYLPLVPVFIERINRQDLEELVPADGLHDMRVQLGSLTETLKRLASGLAIRP